MTTNPPTHVPLPKVFREMIGKQEYALKEEKLDVFSEVALWNLNPRLQRYETAGQVQSEEQLEQALQKTPGYDVLLKSITDVGQMEPIYVWKREGMHKYLVLEGATRVTILRELSRKKQGKPEADKFSRVVVKVLPPDFDEEARVILLARIHVRGSGVRAWGRYIEAKFIHDNVTAQNGKKPLMGVGELANYMGKSISWVSRLKDAYEFVSKFVEYVDDPEKAPKLALDHFSTLEEISKSTGFGVRVRDYNNAEHGKLREEVFEMVKNDVFKEYRDARYIGKFHDDPEKWAQLKTHEKFIANKLANEERVGISSMKGKIEGLKGQVIRSLDRGEHALDEDDLANLESMTRQLKAELSAVQPFRLQLREFAQALQEVPLADIKAITPDEWQELKDGLEDFEMRLNKHKTWN
jgi:hypothetical protein